MDSFTENYLQEWGFEYLINRFKEEEIDRMAFLNLTESMVATLLPKIGQQAKFFKNLQSLREEILKDKETSKSISSDSAPSSSFSLLSFGMESDSIAVDINEISDFEIMNDGNFSSISEGEILSNISDSPQEYHLPESPLVKQNTNLDSSLITANASLGQNINYILSKYQDGQMILEYYNTHKSLNFSMKNKLSSVLIKHELQSDVKINKKKFIDLAKGIEMIFPSENEETYFIPYFKEDNIVSPNRGKLFDKYCNVKRKILKISCNKRADSEPEVPLSYKDYEDSLNWLKNQVQPESVLHKLWVETAPYRLSVQKNENVMDIYPALKKPTGYFLIDLDFSHLFPNKEMSLFNRFETFKDKLKLYLNNNSINIGNKGSELLNKLSNPIKPGDDDLAALQLIPLLFAPVNIVLKNKKIIRPSKIEQSNAFIVNIPNASELKIVHNQKVAKAFACGSTVQPYIVIVGNVDDVDNPVYYYTIINDTQYQLETAIKAVDVCFKLYHVLNLEYPPEAEQIWHFFEHYFFEISDYYEKKGSKKGKKFLSILSLCKDLQFAKV